ncbi:MAG TPA: nicotinate-nucleotide--dimethylbenzimidazole phosphoribosyltransferase [Burkholderiaceae bacterium]|jgi:nicotinate-nucleotide--dimethylbenzimidazole phosphoribosyltransferase|nr:nicotinate-nucleotide--dimethylbenzimidazole phosphoribosyltransferase [Burkholderiaceae bacterium]
MTVQRSLIAPTAHPRLEEALQQKLQRRSRTAGSLGELEPLAIRLGLIQNSLKPQLRSPQLILFCGDHGLVVDGLSPRGGETTADVVNEVLQGRLPLSVFAFQQGLNLTLVDAGLSQSMNPHPSLLPRKIAHGTRNARTSGAMTLDQAHAAIRAGMEISDNLTGNVLACAGVGIGSHESAALVISRLAEVPVRELVQTENQELLAQLMVVLQGAQGRHRDVIDPVEVLAAFGGFEIATMVGAMLVAASKRHLIMVDGMSACAALLVAARIAPPVTDYCVFCRSSSHVGLDRAMAVFRATALLELGMESIDGTGVCLAWPLVNSAAALLSQVAEGEDSGFSVPSGPDAPGPSVELPTAQFGGGRRN